MATMHPSAPPPGLPASLGGIRNLLDLRQEIRELELALARAADATGLNLSQLFALAVCAEAVPHGCEQSRIATRLGTSPAMVSELLESLRGSGALASVRMSTDRRRQVWSLTPAGRALLDAVAQVCDDPGCEQKADTTAPSAWRRRCVA